jgi:hypothetical protein
MTSGRRSGAWAIAVAVLLAVFWLWQRREPSWSVSLIGDPGPAVTPWQPVHLVAGLAPAGAAKRRWWKTGEWKWQWESDSIPFSVRGPEVDWKSGKVKDHRVTVTVESPWGTKKSASMSLTVRYADYVLPDSPQIQKPNLSALPKDPNPEDLPFGIADVWVEKTQVCQGEPTRIRMTPFDKRGRDKWLVPVVAGQQAWEVAFQVPPTHPGVRIVPVSLFDSGMKGGHVASVDTYVYIEVKDCVAPFPMFIEHRPIPPSDDDVAFRLTLFDGPAWMKRLNDAGAPSAAAHAASFRWSFGDGASATTAEPSARHLYPAEVDRADERATLYKVRVDAIDGAGAVMATSYAAVELPNHLRQLKQEQNLLQLVTEQRPGGQDDPNGSRYTDVVLVNLDDSETARLGDVKIRLTSCDGKELGERTASPSTVFQKLVIAPHARISGRFSLPKAGLAGACYANAEVSGESEPGRLKVLGFFQLVTGDPPGVPLTDAQEEVLQKAKALLGNPKVVTTDDLRRLEDEGKIPRYALTRDPFAPQN